jgi:putative ABC transport system substrate-binding protein
VVSLNRPGGNVTGVNFFTSEVAAKRLDLLRQLTPGSGTIAVLIHPNTIQTEAERRDLQEAAQTMRQQLAIFDVDSERDIETAFAKLAQEGVTAVLAGAGPFMNSHRVQLVTLAARHALPMSYTTRDAVVAGGLMS